MIGAVEKVKCLQCTAWHLPGGSMAHHVSAAHGHPLRTTRVTTFNIDDRIIKKIKGMVERGRYTSQSQAVCFLLAKQLHVPYKPDEMIMIVGSRRVCQKCGASFKKKASYAAHVSTCGKDPPKQVCGICGKVFKSKKGRIGHETNCLRRFVP